MEGIYSDIRAELLKTEFLGDMIYIYDIGTRYAPSLILPNKTAVIQMRNYLTKTLTKMEESDE